MPKRILDCTKSDFMKMTAKDLIESIKSAEGRTVLSQVGVRYSSIVSGTTNIELAAAFGSDMILVNGYRLDSSIKMRGFEVFNPHEVTDENQYEYMRLSDVKKLINRPIGIYLECPDLESKLFGVRRKHTADRIATEENLKRVIDEQADFVVLGGNPNTGTSIKTIIHATKLAKRVLGDKIMIWAGKWEDGTAEKVLGDPTADYDSIEVTKELIDAGADVVCLPAPGSRLGITTKAIREIVEFVHTYKENTLAMVFLDGSVEGAHEDTIRDIGLMMKETGADIHAIGDAGFTGVPVPEDIYQLCLTIKGRRHTYRRIAANNR